MTQKPAALKRKPDISPREFRATIFGVCFASTIALVGIVVGLKPAALADLAAYHQQACTDHPVLLSWTQHVLPLMPAVLGLLLLLPLASAVWTVARQFGETSRLCAQVHQRSGRVPPKLAGAAKSLGIRDRIVCVQDRAVYAFCFGLVSPRICISRGMASRLSRRELEAVLLHELSHLSNRDPLRVLVGRVLTSALILLPVARELRERYQLSMELTADRKALARMPVEVLASALLKVFSSPNSNLEYQLAPIGALDVTRERILRLAGPAQGSQTPPLPISSLLISTFVAIALFLGTAGFSEASSYWSSKAHTCAPVAGVIPGTDGNPVTLNPVAPKCSHAVVHPELPHAQ
ncbi:MAG: M56 family metallopeptidase [Chloroflexi bacterium]|nr:M56 family metallopeptidase [Chloroflexota bacterium]